MFLRLKRSKTRLHATSNNTFAFAVWNLEINFCLLDLSRQWSDWWKSTIASPCVQPSVRGRSAGSLPEQRLVIEPRRRQKITQLAFESILAREFWWLRRSIGTLRYPGRGGKENGESLERGRRHLRGKNKLRLSRFLGGVLSCVNIHDVF